MNIKKAAFLPLLPLLAITALGQGTNSFENGLTGWTVSAGATAIVGTSASPEAQFPTQGSQYAEITAGTTGGAVAGYGPHPAGTGTNDVAKLSRVVNRPLGDNCNISIDWTFFQNEGNDDATFNDFLSIDVIDVATGALIENLVFVDTGVLAGTPFYTNIPGAGAGDPVYVDTPAGDEVAPAGFKRASVNVGGATVPGQQLRIEISVGNGTDASVDCRALVDNLRITGDGDSTFNALRVLGSRHQDGSNSTGGDGNADYTDNRFRRRVVPTEPITLRYSGRFGNGGGGWALLLGQPTNAAPDFGFGGFSLDVPTISAVVDGLNPTTVADAALGTLSGGDNYISAAMPASAAAGVFGLQAIMADPANGPLFISATALTEIEFAAEPQIPTGDTDVLDAGGSLLGLDDFGVVDLSSVGGFDFYGVNYTEAFVNSNGAITFGAGNTGFTESVSEFVQDQPRIAVLWDDFDRLQSGDIRSNISGDVVTISWTDLAECCQDDSVVATNMSVQLFPDGTITCYYGSMSSISGLAGISPGNFMGPVLPSGSGVDLSGFGFQRGNRNTVAPNTAMWQIFREETPQVGDGTDYNDLITLGANSSPSRITYVPDGAGGYTVFTGTN